MNNQQDVFLSHSGLDSELANLLSRRIAHALNVRVFNTSDPEDRFKDLKDILQPGVVWSVEAERYHAELKEYLRKNLLGSKVYVLLVTERSLKANSAWIEYEMNLASEEAHKKGAFFFPCVAGGAALKMLPRVAIRFQGIELEAENGFGTLIDVIGRVLEKR